MLGVEGVVFFVKVLVEVESSWYPVDVVVKVEVILFSVKVLVEVESSWYPVDVVVKAESCWLL